MHIICKSSFEMYLLAIVKVVCFQETGNLLTEGRLLVPICIQMCILLQEKMMAASIASQV
jgi:hypothetical protein